MTKQEFEETKKYILNCDVKRTKKISALEALDNIKKYITNHKTQQAHWDAFKVYINN